MFCEKEIIGYLKILSSDDDDGVEDDDDGNIS